MSTKTIQVEFSGGCELLFNNQKKHSLNLPEKILTLKDLLQWIKETLLKERPELFISEGTVRPGILVLINDCDWELVGGIDYEIKSGDNIVFISTLHGG